MPITSLEIKDKTFGTRFRGFDPEEVDEFLDIVVRDYEDLVRSNHDKETHIKSLEERLSYFDEMKDSLSQSVLIAQDTAERVKQAAQERCCLVYPGSLLWHRTGLDLHRNGPPALRCGSEPSG